MISLGLNEYGAITMALVKCSEWEKKISGRAETCPNCGVPLSSNQVQVEFTVKNLK
jgi:hypothetical protein